MILDKDLQMAYAEMQVVPGGQLITHVSPIIELSSGVVVVPPDRWRIDGNEVVIIMEDDNGNKNRDS